METILNTNFGLELTGGERDLYGELLEAFLKTALPQKEEFLQLEKSPVDEEREKAAKKIHLVKGGALQIGAERLGAAAKRLEVVVRGKETGDIDALTDAFFAEFEKAYAEVKRVVGDFCEK